MTKDTMKKQTLLTYAAGLGLTAVIVAGCSGPPAAHSDAPAPEFFQSIYQKLPDGRTVLCLYKQVAINGYSNGAAPTMSCDWAGAVVHP